LGTDGLDLYGNEFDNTLIGGDGDDQLDGGAGADQLDGGAGDDLLIDCGCDFNDTLNGGDGEDVLVSGGGADTLSGGADADLFAYVAASDSTHAAYDTILDFTVGVDALDFTDIGVDGFRPLVTVTTAPSTIAAHTIEAFVSGGNTILYVNDTDTEQAADSASMEIHLAGVTGLTDSDIAAYDFESPIADLSATATSISFVATDPDGGSFSLTSPFDSAFGNPAVTSGATTELTPGAQGSELAGILQISDGTTVFDVMGLYLGTNGDDDAFAPAAFLSNALYGFGGDDTLTGDGAPVAMFGGTGNDTYYVHDFFDTVFEEAGEGTDTIYTSTDFVLADGSEVEVLQVSGTDGLQLVGNEFDNTLVGGVGDDTLDGGAGADQLDGGAGDDVLLDCSCDFNDTLNGGDGVDVLVSGGGADTLSGGADADLFAYIDASDSTHAAYDTILDFTVGEDKLDFVLSGDAFNPLVTVTTAPSTIAAHTIEAFVSGGDTILYVNDTDFDQATDLASMEIHLTGVTTLRDADLLFI